jgi:hypothetical protein
VGAGSEKENGLLSEERLDMKKVEEKQETIHKNLL